MIARWLAIATIAIGAIYCCKVNAIELPDFGMPDKTPTFTNWRIRQAFLSYENDKTLVKQAGVMFDMPTIIAIGNTKGVSHKLFGNRNTIFLYIQGEHIDILLQPNALSVVYTMRW